MPDLTEYTVGWICAVEAELVAARAFLDEVHDAPDYVPPDDNNTYTLGRMGKHNVVIAALPHWQYGLVSAATVARDMARSFANVRIGLMVGIGGGAPSSKHDIRLGDIVVTSPGYSNGGVLQYDYGKTVQGKSFTVTGYLNQPPQLLLTALTAHKAVHEIDGHGIKDAIDKVIQRKPRLRRKYQRPDPSTDNLYKSNYTHVGDNEASCVEFCAKDESNIILRSPRQEDQDNPEIHYGLIASANQLMQDALLRDKLSKDRDVLCFEMEAAGLMNHFPCLVIRGICDYSDTHKNEKWQGYAAMAAAAYAKDLLNQIAPNKVEAERKLSDVLSGVDEKLSQILSGIESQQADRYLRKLMAWLSPPDPSTNFNRALTLRHEGTGSWFLESPQYKDWKIKHSSFLWLNGIPGCGKTILASTVIEDLRKDEVGSPIVLYFYFDFSDTEKQFLDKALCSLISQLYAKGRNVQNHVDSLHSSCDNGNRKTDLKSLWKTFQEMIRRTDEVWIVLDALDECDIGRQSSNSELLDWIRDLQQSETNTHLLVTSRPEYHIKSAIEDWALREDFILFQSRVIGDDIRGYIDSRIINSKELKRWRSHPKVQEEIRETLVDKADGMFRWVVCQLDALEKCLHLRAVHETLNSLPITLDETYSRMIASVPPIYKHETTRCLQFLTYSDRPLSVDELVDAIAVDMNSQPRFDPKYRMPDPEEITRYCSSLISVREEEWDPGSSRTLIIQLAHYSVKEYLMSDRLDEEFRNSLSKINASVSIAKVCLAYLIDLDKDALWSNHKTDYPKFSDYEYPENRIMIAYPMIRYAINFWPRHAVVAEESLEQDRQLIDLILDLFKCRKARRFCRRNDGNEVLPALHYTSYWGLAHTAQHLIDIGADMNFMHEKYGSALFYAISHGHFRVVQIFLKNCADIDIPDFCEFNRTPLGEAAFRGYDNIVTELLKKGAEVDWVDVRGNTPLTHAAAFGRSSTVRLLLDHGANVHEQGGKYHTALIAAAYGGKESIVEMLLEGGADIHAQGGKYHTALIVAAYRGQEGMVKMLLDKGADVNAQRGKTYKEKYLYEERELVFVGGVLYMIVHT
ncbi:hypothetical protein GGR54DRAFT_266866 [Hypoxylon sp. NC1633]|nr:hypothetical protein GGR54DRAFT_266866 [Hypoxylon sp. NC1633]